MTLTEHKRMTHPETPAQRRKRAAPYWRAMEAMDLGDDSLYWNEGIRFLLGLGLGAALYMDDDNHRATALGIYAAMIEAGDA